MPAIQLPLFSPDFTEINKKISFQKREGRVYYFHYYTPLFSHDEADLESFHLITSQLVINGSVKAIEISRAFGVPYISVKRNVKRLKEEGSSKFFQKRKGRSTHILTDEVIEKAQNLLNKGHTAAEVGRRLNLKANTIRKAIQAGRLKKRKKQEKNAEEEQKGQTKSERALDDAQADMGIGCTRVEERVEAALGELNGAEPLFTANIDVKSAGVLLTLPSLLWNGLLKFSEEHLSLSKGYYGLQSVLVLLAFVALLRIKSIEGVRYCEPGELGKLIGLDRIPEVKTLRQKIAYIATYGDIERWGKELAEYWMEEDPDLAGIIYVDGHVRVYHGHKTNLPKRYVAREKLCLKGVTDYWINDALGRPFFVVTQEVNSGMLAVLREKIVPRLKEDIPHQPSDKELKADSLLYRFGMVFDREGYSPEFFKQMWQDRIACYTYRKYAREEWSEKEFHETTVIFPNGERGTMKLAERGIYYKKPKIWIREIRKLKDTGHQTAIVTTDYHSKTEQIAGTMFSRWSQENFFKYMMQHYGIDRLIDYKMEKIDDTVKVVNPEYRELERQMRSKNSKLSRKRAEYGALILKSDIEEDKVKDYVQKKSELKAIIESLQEEVEVLRAEKKQKDKHIDFSQLPESDQFKIFKKSGKQFMDSIKMIAYRAETAMVNILREYIGKKDEARSLVRQIFQTDADIEPDKEQGILKIKLHNMGNPRNNEYIKKLCNILNDSETIFPGTNLVMVYDLVSSQNPADQEF
jgi:hypothetical protein